MLRAPGTARAKPAVPWHVAGITHLEADLHPGSPDLDPSGSEQLRELPFAPAQAPIVAVGLPAGRWGSDGAGGVMPWRG